MLRACAAFLLALCVSDSVAASAQDGGISAPVPVLSSASIRRFEIGFDSPAVRTPYSRDGGCCPALAVGIGGTVNINPRFSMDTRLIRTTGQSVSASNFFGGHILEFLSGARAEIRARRYGYFVRAQAGFQRWDHVITGVVFPTPNTFTFLRGSHTNFMSDVGAGFEFAATDRIHLRAGVGDLVIREARSDWTNVVQPDAGIYVGLGRPVVWHPPVYSAKAVHPFWDLWNSIAVAGSELAMTADSITTQRFISRGQVEGNPLAAPLVKYGWSGQISLQGMETSAEILGIYGLHRIGHHWIERLVPCSIAVAHGVFAYQNARAGSHPRPAP